MHLRAISLAATVFFLGGCAVNERTAHNYANAGVAASQRGAWAAAREHWRRAVINARLGHMSNQALAVAHYEYGRASGVVCNWAEAESALTEAYRLDFISEGPTYKVTYELGRMYSDRKMYAKAVEQFSKVKAQFEKLQAETKDPVGYAEFLDEHAYALEQTGFAKDAMPLRQRAVELRKTFPGRASHTEKTPYGTQCKST
jgi:tetratricopeptide (TPR) repeat protein